MIDLTETSCRCLICQLMCANPCWPTPDEAKRIIEAGYGSRLQLHIEPHNGQALYVIAPKTRAGVCAFLSDRGNCVLHRKGLKPLEGRLASCKATQSGQAIRDHVADFWSNKEAGDFAVDFHISRLLNSPA